MNNTVCNIFIPSLIHNLNLASAAGFWVYAAELLKAKYSNVQQLNQQMNFIS
jgi:hypothetical protein